MLSSSPAAARSSLNHQRRSGTTLKDPSATRSSNQTAETFNFTLDEGLAVTSGDTLFTLEPFDEVFVRFSPGYQKQQVVKVGGEITLPATIL